MIDEEEPAEAAQDDATVPLRDQDDRTAPLEISYLGTKLAMAIYVTLVNFTDQGVRNVKDLSQQTPLSPLCAHNPLASIATAGIDYSITSSARARSVGGMVRLSARAVLWLTIVSR